MKVRFLHDREVLNGRGQVVRAFRAGQVVELSAASARHFLNRGAAEEAVGEPAATRRKDEGNADRQPKSDAAAGGSDETGTAKPSASSGPEKASATSTSGESAPPEKPVESDASSSTAAGKKPAGRTGSTPATQSGGGATRKRSASKG